MLHFQGLLIGIFSFLVIGLFHPVVIKLEYHVGKKIWWAFLVPGILLFAASFFLPQYLSIGAGVLGGGFIWSTFEIIKQHERVCKGHAKMNPKRSHEYKSF